MKYNEQYLKNILNDCNQSLTEEELKKFIKEIGKYVMEKLQLNISIGFSQLDGSIATTYSSISSSGNNSYVMYFDINKIYKQSGLIGINGKDLPNLLKIIHTVMHEIQHVIQKEKYSNINNICNEDIIMIKEGLNINLQKYYWNKLPSEFDAEICGWKFVLELLSEFSYTNYRTYFTKINREIEDLEYRCKNATIPIMIEGKEVILPSRQAITIIATEQIKKKPDILSIYPILKIVYDASGKKKDFNTLMSEKENILRNIADSNQILEIEKLYDELISSDRDLIAQKRKEAGDSSIFNQSIEKTPTFIRKPYIKKETIELIRKRKKSGDTSTFNQSIEKTPIFIKKPYIRKEIIESIQKKVNNNITPEQELKIKQDERKQEIDKLKQTKQEILNQQEIEENEEDYVMSM